MITFLNFNFNRKYIMALEFKDSERIISSYGSEQFERLFNLNEKIKSDGASELLASQVMSTCYDIPIMVSFDWGAWSEGEEAMKDEDFSDKSVHFLCLLLTAIIRSDRFNENYFYNLVQSGLVSQIIDSIKKSLSEDTVQ